MREFCVIDFKARRNLALKVESLSSIKSMKSRTRSLRSNIILCYGHGDKEKQLKHLSERMVTLMSKSTLKQSIAK